jgi:peptidoglycan/xylan/chitin deacetylase (PgdA/CDA1 family)
VSATSRPRRAVRTFRLRVSTAVVALATMAVVVLPLPFAAPVRDRATPDRAQAWPAPASSRVGPQSTVVSLTFDDGSTDQLAAADSLRRHSMAGTFYVVSGWVGTAGRLSLENLRMLVADGNEIGGHTERHVDLTTLGPAAAAREICGDRSTLLRWGFRVTSLAYPFGGTDEGVAALARTCGYNSARQLRNLRSPFTCRACPVAETRPPKEPYVVRATDDDDSRWTLAHLQQRVEEAEAEGGGWLPLVFHHVCERGCGLNITPELFDQFVQWLSLRQSMGTVVRTVDQVMRGDLRPAVAVPTVVPLPNPSLETGDAAGARRGGAATIPQCWQPSSYGDNTAAWSRVADAHSGQWAQRLQVTAYSEGSVVLMPDTSGRSCAPAARPHQQFTLTAWYKSSAFTQFDIYYRRRSGGWAYFTSSPWFPSSGTWSRGSWTTRGLPADAVAVSFGLSLFSRGWLVADDYSLLAWPVGSG